MALKIMPHGRLQEWVAEEKGYFAAEDLEYSFPCTGEAFAATRRWAEVRSLFPGSRTTPANYEEVTLVR